MTSRVALVIAALLMAAAVALGAFGAHALKSRLSPEMLAVWQTAVQYHAWHALALLGTGVLLARAPEAASFAIAAWLFVAGIALFSGTLYALALTGTRALGALTPFGGIAFMGGWLVLAWGAWRA
jgi:uncharacterized membrane protein YgdD (TMEM256/DUF423 family)